MVDNRAAGFYGVAGAFNFKSGDISGKAAKTSDDRASQGTEYGVINGEEENPAINENRYVDNSAQINATLSSLAMMNVASVINSKLPKYNPYADVKKIIKDAEYIVTKISLDEDRKQKSKDEETSEKQEEDDNEYY